MILFSKEKNIILNIANLVLLLWITAATVISYAIVIEIVRGEAIQTYDEYVIANCQAKDLEVKDDVMPTTDCETSYVYYKQNFNSQRREKINGLLIAIGNVLIVGTIIYVLNKEKNGGK